MNGEAVRNVLLVKMSSLGDVVHALPAVSDAAEHGVRIDWVVEEAFADIPASHPAVNRVFTIAWRRWRRQLRAAGAEMTEFLAALRQQEYDLIIDSQGLIKSAVVSLLARGRRTGFSFTAAREPWAAFAHGRGHAISVQQHAVDRQRQLLAGALGYEVTTPAVSGLEVTAPRSRQVILLHGTTWSSKHWPVNMWQELARLIHGAGYEPLVTWGDASEQRRAQEIAAPGHAMVIDRQPLHALAQVLGAAAAVIGVDSGLCHYSAALGTPTVGLYGTTSGLLTGCRGVAATALQATTACSPCLHKDCRSYRGAPLQWGGVAVDPPCFATLPPEYVWERAQSVIQAHHVRVLAD
jgi:heptosyltransferase-1